MSATPTLLQYRHCYHYSFEQETVVIPDGEDAAAAAACYQSVLRRYRLTDDALARWAFDIALDLLRTLPPCDAEALRQGGDALQLHFGLGLMIRNRYLYPAERHRIFSPDDFSARIGRTLLALLRSQA